MDSHMTQTTLTVLSEHRSVELSHIFLDQILSMQPLRVSRADLEWICDDLSDRLGLELVEEEVDLEGNVGDLLALLHQKRGSRYEPSPLSERRPEALMTLRHRYGGTSELPVEQALEAIPKLLKELATEEFEEPDDEHYQVSISHPNGWCLTVYLQGLLRVESLADLGSDRAYEKVIVSREQCHQDIRDFIEETGTLTTWSTSRLSFPEPWFFRTIS